MTSEHKAWAICVCAICLLFIAVAAALTITSAIHSGQSQAVKEAAAAAHCTYANGVLSCPVR